MKTDTQKLTIIQARAKDIFKDKPEIFIRGAVCYGAKNMGINLKDAGEFLGVKRPSATQYFQKFDQESTYQEVKDLIVFCTEEIYKA